MLEQNVANGGYSLYAQDRAPKAMAEDVDIKDMGAPAPEVGKKTSDSEAEASKPSRPKIEIPLVRAKTALSVLGAIREGKDVVVDDAAVSDFRTLILDFTQDDKKAEVEKKLNGLDANGTILELDQFVSGVEFIAPTAEEFEADLKEKEDVLAKGKRRLVGMGVMDEDQLEADDKKTLKQKLSDELTEDLDLLQRAKKFGESPLTAEQISGKVTYSKEELGREAKDSGPGTTPYTGADWATGVAGLKDPLGKYAREIKEIEDIAKTNTDFAIGRLKNLLNSLGDPDADPTGDVKKLRTMATEGILKMGEFMDDEKFKKQIEVEVDVKKRERIQRIYYGESTIPTAENIDPTNSEEGFKDKSENTNIFLADLIADGKITVDEVKILRTLDRATLESFREGKCKDARFTAILNPNQQEDFYRALHKDQMIWVLKKLNELPLQDMDITMVGGTISYKDFLNAMTKDTLADVTEFSKNVSFSYEMKYRFSVGGMDSLAQKASDVQDALEVCTREVKGWDEVVAEIEAFITRERIDGEETYLPILREKYAKNPSSLTPAELSVLKRTAEGRYVYTANKKDGSVESMRPKTKKEIDQDKIILGYDVKTGEIGESWKVGGFLDASEKGLDKMRAHLYEKALAKIRTNKEFVAEGEEAMQARAKLAAFEGEWLFWRMAGRSAYWGEQGSVGGAGELQMFTVIAFQRYACQEAKGSGEVGRRMRKIMFGADTAGTYNDTFVPGMAGGTNFNLGYWDIYSQYTVAFPGERETVKTMQEAGFVRGMGLDQKTKIDNIIAVHQARAKKRIEDGENADKVWSETRAALNKEELEFLEWYNNLPIVSLATKSSRDALDKLASSSKDDLGRTWGDSPDYYGGDFQGPNKLRQLMATHDSGFLSNPDARMLGQIAQLSEGRKRVWQRAKLIMDAAEGLLEFKSFWNKKLTGIDNWNTEDADMFLTKTRDNLLKSERNKMLLEEKHYRKMAKKGLSRFVPLLKEPWAHKLVYLQAKKPGSISLKAAAEALWAMVLEYLKRWPREAVPGGR